MWTCRGLASVALSCLTLCAAAARAQVASPAGPTARSAAAAMVGLRAGIEVRVATGGRHVRGPLAVPVRGDSVAILERGAPVALPLRAVDTLWVRRGNAGRGAAVGAVVGGFALAVLGASACSGSNSECTGGDAGQVIAVGAGVGMAGGALLGALIGAVAGHWERRYP